jgi:site-specific DNA-methyltransferase (adenine-specific)
MGDERSDNRKNTFYCGDNLDVLKRGVPDDFVDLIYIDPPFNSGATYNVLFKPTAKQVSKETAQIQAFEDTWTWGGEAVATFQGIVTGTITCDPIPTEVVSLVETLSSFLKESPMMAYLVMMTPRLVELRRVLKTTGAIYVHCDPTASHYLKLLMDAIYGREHFVNEVVWQRTNAKGLAMSRFASNHDIILMYAKGASRTWNPQYTPHDPEYLHKFYRFVEPSTLRRYRLADLTNPNHDRPNLTYEFLGVKRIWRWTRERMEAVYKDGIVIQTHPSGVPVLKRYLDEQEGNPVGDVWVDISPISAQATERLGYPTQKPEALLERIIKSSSNSGDIALDALAGCSTVTAVAQRSPQTLSSVPSAGQGQ